MIKCVNFTVEMVAIDFFCVIVFKLYSIKGFIVVFDRLCNNVIIGKMVRLGKSPVSTTWVTATSSH